MNFGFRISDFGLRRLVFVGVGFTLNVAVWAQSFTVTSRPLEIPEAGTVTESVAHAAGTEFSFIAPPNWKQTVNATQQRLEWMSRDLASVLSLTVRTEAGESTPTVRTNAMRDAALQRHPGSKVLGQFPCTTRSGRGWAVDLEQAVENGLARKIRIAFVPFASGIVEFELVTSPAAFAQQARTLGHLMNSFRAVPQSAAASGPRPSLDPHHKKD